MKIRFFLLAFLCAFLGYSQMSWSKLDGGFGCGLFNDGLATAQKDVYVAQKDVYVVTTWSFITLNGNMSYNLKEWTEQSALSLDIDPQLSFLNMLDGPDMGGFSMGRFSLPMQAKYKFGRGATNESYNALGFSVGAGMAMHWDIPNDVVKTTYDPQVVLSFSVRYRRKKGFLASLIFQDREQPLPSGEWMLIYGLPSAYNRGADILEEGKYVWLGLMWRVRFW